MKICYDYPRKGMELVINSFSYGGGLIYQCDSLCRMQDKNGGNTLHVILKETTDNEYDGEKTVVELNQFMNTWNPYVEPKEEIKDEVGEEVHAQSNS